MSKRVIAVFTGNRAEYGLQYPILRAIDAHPDLSYRLIISGAHLGEGSGRTSSEIHEDGFTVHAEARINVIVDTLYGTALAIGTGVNSIAEALAKVKPDILLAYGDRFESFAAIIASTQMNIPTAHVEGGDVTEGGALDDSVRHAMTKIAHLHFTTNQQASNRILGMGEEAWRVHTVGYPAIDLIQNGEFTDRNDIVKLYGLDLTRPIVLFTQHSVATQFEQASMQIRRSLAGLKQLADEGVQIIVTYPNNDAGGRQIIAEIEAFAAEWHSNIQFHSSLGRANYHGVLAIARDTSIRIACVGNSSSGIKETPAFGCPAVNVGSRQDGRLRSDNVVNVGYDTDELVTAVKRCLCDDGFRDLCRRVNNPYGVGDAGKKIADILAKTSLNQSLMRKRMMLVGETRDGWFR